MLFHILEHQDLVNIKKEEELYGLARALARVYHIYSAQKTLEGKMRWKINLQAYAFVFKSACDTFYQDEKSAPEWLRYLNQEKNRILK